MSKLRDTYFTPEFVKDLVHLKLWYVWHLVVVEKTPFVDALKWTSFYDKSTFKGADDSSSDVDGWHCVQDELERLLDAECQSPEIFQSRGLDLIWPHIEPAVGDQIAMLDRRWEDGVVGCVRYEYRASYRGADAGDALTLHFRNMNRPESPFRNRSLLTGSLLEIIARTHRTHPHISEVQMGSWLNSFPPFLSLFPHAWDASGRVSGPGGHMGWWGQFMDSAGNLHGKHVQMFKTNGIFPFDARSCRCAIQALSGHLQDLQKIL